MFENAKLIFYTIIHFTFWILISPFLIIDNIRWNSGLCIKCKNNIYQLDFRPDRFINNQYVCKGCGFRYNSIKQRESINERNLKKIVREQKLKKLKI